MKKYQLMAPGPTPVPSEVLLAMARETRVNFDIHPGIEGTVNLNAIDQTLKQILTRMSKQVDMRWEVDGQTISVMPDTPYLRSYRVDLEQFVAYLSPDKTVPPTVASIDHGIIREYLGHADLLAEQADLECHGETAPTLPKRRGNLYPSPPSPSSQPARDPRGTVWSKSRRIGSCHSRWGEAEDAARVLRGRVG